MRLCYLLLNQLKKQTRKEYKVAVCKCLELIVH